MTPETKALCRALLQQWDLGLVNFVCDVCFKRHCTFSFVCFAYNGKKDINPEILNKEGDLSDEDWEVIKNHPAAGHELLEPARFNAQATAATFPALVASKIG